MIDALYVHIPFCEAKCNYCDFLSFPQFGDEIKAKYIEALKKETVLRKQSGEIKLKTIFIGGGTPTCLSGRLLNHLLFFLNQNFAFGKTKEFSVEANPGTLNKNKLQILLEGGVNRLSLGAQSFKQAELQRLGRIHTPEEIIQSYYLAREAGFDNLNLDLMYGLPEQTLKSWEENLIKILDLNPEHISLYQLKIEEGTSFFDQFQKGEIAEFPDELAVEMYQLAKEYLTQAGYEHYEISNYAKPGLQSIHNQTYWLTKPYLGLGAGAHSFIAPVRRANLGNLDEYLKALSKGELPPCEEERLLLKTLMSEFMFMGLRLITGVNLSDFQKRFGQDAKTIFKPAIDKCLKLGLVELSNNNLRLTDRGVVLGNLVFEQFLL